MGSSRSMGSRGCIASRENKNSTHSMVSRNSTDPREPREPRDSSGSSGLSRSSSSRSSREPSLSREPSRSREPSLEGAGGFSRLGADVLQYLLVPPKKISLSRALGAGTIP